LLFRLFPSTRCRSRGLCRRFFILDQFKRLAFFRCNRGGMFPLKRL
jgi:hypothetical protein